VRPVGRRGRKRGNRAGSDTSAWAGSSRWVPVQQQQAESVLLHGRLIGRRWRPELEFGVHHGSIGVVRAPIRWRQPGHEAAVLLTGADVVAAAAADHRCAAAAGHHPT